MGPGIVTGAADDDPSGIATYSQAGAQFGYEQLWTALYLLPFLIAIQEACARIGGVTGQGLAAVVKKHYSKTILYFVVILLFVANTINIGADIGAMASAIQLILPIPFFILVLILAASILLLEVFISYQKYAKFLKSLCIVLLVYPATLFIIQVPWNTVLKATFIPNFEFSFEFLFIITGVFGTTISPYMFFWQASQVAEEAKKNDVKKNNQPDINQQGINNLRIDNFIGMLFSEIGCWSIMIVASAVLHAHGVTEIKSSADAAKALEPLVQSFSNSGYVAKLLFSTGILGLGLLAVPVLAASAAYAMSEAF